MFSTLRRRFIFSHLVPLLIIVPLIGIALIYLLEAQVVLPSLSTELAGQAGLVVEMARDQSGVWTDSTQAQALVARVNPRLTARLMLLDASGRLLASSDPNDAARLGSLLDHSGLKPALSGQLFSQQARSRGLRAEVADVLVPALGANRQVAGVVRLSYPLTSVYARFQFLRYLVAGVLVVGLILGAIVGAMLALDLSRPIRDTTALRSNWHSGNRRSHWQSRDRRKSARWRARSISWRLDCTHSKSRGTGYWPTWCTSWGGPSAHCWPRCRPSPKARTRIRRCAASYLAGWKRKSIACSAC